MLAIPASKQRFCDGVSRRSFLHVGGLAFAGVPMLSLADILRSEARAAGRTSQAHRSVINVFLGGGPPHQDMFDIKEDAPLEIRGEFESIATNVPGIRIGECFPRLAQMTDKLAIIRSVVGSEGRHDAFQCMTGWKVRDLEALGGRPSIGAVASKALGSSDPSVPPFVGLAKPTSHQPWSDAGQPGFLGPAFQAFKPDGPGLQNLSLNGVTTDQLADRRQLLSSLDALRRDIDHRGAIGGMDSFVERAFGVLTSSRLLNALNLDLEDAAIRERYGTGKPFQYQYDGAPTDNEQLLMARRLVQAGVRVVSLSYGRWDSHGKNFDLVRDHGGKLDQCLSALLWDLERLNMLETTTVVVWGEFGRTPRVNQNAGRDHWPQVSCAVLAGGGLRTGQVIGATNRLGEHAEDRPVTFQEIFATLYHALGLDPGAVTIDDPAGRPQYLVDHRYPLPELV